MPWMACAWINAIQNVTGSAIHFTSRTDWWILNVIYIMIFLFHPLISFCEGIGGRLQTKYVLGGHAFGWGSSWWDKRVHRAKVTYRIFPTTGGLLIKLSGTGISWSFSTVQGFSAVYPALRESHVRPLFHNIRAFTVFECPRSNPDMARI